jgi:hypothetical protein
VRVAVLSSHVAVAALGAVTAMLGPMFVRWSGRTRGSSEWRHDPPASYGLSLYVRKLLRPVGMLLVVGAVLGAIFWGNRGAPGLPWCAEVPFGVNWVMLLL